jgi:hypothetical protein
MIRKQGGTKDIMAKVELNVEQVITLYTELKSSYKVADYLSTSATAVKRVLKDAGVLRTQKLAALERDNSHCGIYERTEEHKQNLSECAKKRTGSKNAFYDKTHTKETKEKLASFCANRIGKANPNYRHGKNLRRPRDFKQSEFTRLRNQAFNRDKFTCQITKVKSGSLHAHHLLPYWVCPEAFLDIDNLITVSTKTHLEICHEGSWSSFNVNIIPDFLLFKYKLDRERLNEMASLYRKKR